MEKTQRELIIENRNLLLFSDVVTDGNYDGDGREWLKHGEEAIRRALGDKIENVVVIDYAPSAIGENSHKYKNALARMGVRTTQLHKYPGGEQDVIKNAKAILVTGGHNGNLAANLHGSRHRDDQTLVDTRIGASAKSLVARIRDKISEGIPFIGISAGAIATGPDFRSGNDTGGPTQRDKDGKPLTVAETVSGLNIVKFGINPHFPNSEATDQEQREKRIHRLHLTTNEDGTVIFGLPNESFLEIRGKVGTLLGGSALVFKPQRGDIEGIFKGQDISEFLQT